MIRKGKISYTPSITELGIFSLLLANAKTGEIILNQVDGLLPRTKQADCDEGGVTAGFAVIDHLLLTDCEVQDLKPSVSNILSLI
jgi:glutathione synthase